MATTDQYKEAIARVKNSPSTASAEDWRLTRKMAAQAGSGLPSEARQALKPRS